MLARRRRATTSLLAAALAITVLPGATSVEDESDPGDGSANLQHLVQVEFPGLPASGFKATDSDFVTFTIPGDDVTDPDPKRPKVCDKPLPRDFVPPPCRTDASGQTAQSTGEPWSLPAGDENGGIDLPADYDPAPGDARLFNAMGTYGHGMFVTDVTDPADPVVVAKWDCGVLQADVFVFEQEQADGSIRTLAAYAQDATNAGNRDTQCFRDIAEKRGEPLPGNARGTFLVDLTDPYRPQTVSYLPMRKGTHQTTVHPSGRYVYNSAAVLVTTQLGTIEVYDVGDPEQPQLVSELMLQTGLDSHDMTFNEDGTRLYSAALTHSLIIDTSDPEDPSIIGRVIDPSINIHHDAHAVTVDTLAGERSYLLIGDELAGAAGNGYCPGGGIHVFDITGPLEQAPVKVGAFFIPDVRPAGTGSVDGIGGSALRCTAHVIQVLPEQELLVMGWYNGGVRVLDYSGLANLAGVSVGVGNQTLTPGIQQVGWFRFQDSDLWSAKVHEVADDGSFHIFGGDLGRHFDIWRFDPEAASSADAGTWLDAATAGLFTADALPQDQQLRGSYTPFCLLPAPN